jgi:SNF2 family DNA or RNA helicase
MTQAPEKLSHWPKNLCYVFDTSNPQSAKTILLSTYDTFASRTLNTVFEKREGKKDRKRYMSKWKNIFNVVILDEGHKLRHPWTKIYAAVKGLMAEIHWFLTATPVVNSSVVGYSLSSYMKDACN